MIIHLSNSLNKLIIILSVLISCVPKNKLDNEPQNLVKNFFKLYEEEGPKSSLSKLLYTNKYLSEQNIDSVSLRLEKFTKGLGDYQGYEIISISSYGEGIQSIVCLVKYSQLPIRFKFKYYQPGNGWRIQDFNFHSNFDFEEDEKL